jgi:hypothetical protein
VPNPVELYQLIGSALRDVTQARFSSDLYSRQISFQYERDSLLRRFPVPRVDIDEAEINLYFAVKAVEIDPSRRTSRNAAIGALFHSYGIRIARDAMDALRKAGPKVLSGGDLAQFEKRLLSEDNLEMMGGRITQYLNENVEKVLVEGSLNADKVKAYLADEVRKPIFEQPELITLAPEDARVRWRAALVQAGADVLPTWNRQIDDLAAAVAATQDKYPDFKVVVDVDPEAVRNAGPVVSSIKIKGSIKNYKWAKVDIDKSDMRNIRTLNAE